MSVQACAPTEAVDKIEPVALLAARHGDF